MFNIFKKKSKPKNQFESIVDELKANPGSCFFGHKVDDNTSVIKNLTKEPHALFVGSMGSGKTVAAFGSILTTTVANPNDLVIVVDLLKGAVDYIPLFAYQRVLPFVNNQNYISGVIELLYGELKERQILFANQQVNNYLEYNKKSSQPLGAITLVWEEAHRLDFTINYIRDENKPGTDAGKFKTLVRLGRSYGLNIVLVSQRCTSADLPSSLLSCISNVCAFRISKTEANYLGLPEAGNLNSNDKGIAINYSGKVKFPYISQEQAKDIISLDKQKNDNIPTLASVSKQGLTQLKTNPGHILSPKYYKTITMLDEAEVLEDLEFWDFVENGPKSKK